MKVVVADTGVLISLGLIRQVDIELFRQAKLDEEVHTIVWPNGADFEPSLLYNWNHHLAELIARAKQWQMEKV